MKKGTIWIGILVAIGIILAIVFAIFLAKFALNKIKQPAPLKRGIHLVLQVVTDDALNIETDQRIMYLKNQFKKKNIEFGTIIKDKTGQFSIQKINPDQEGQIKELLDDDFREWNYVVIGNTVSLHLRPNAANYLRDQCVEIAMEIIRGRLDELGLKRAFIQRQGLEGDRIIVELPQVKNPERAINITKTTAFLEWKLVKAGPAPDRETLLKDYGGEVPEDMVVLKGDPRRTEGGYYLVSQVAIITGRDIIKARRSADEWNSPAVSFTLESDGAERFYHFTSENIEKPLAIVLDGKIQSVATIQDRIRDSGMIHGRFTIEEAEDLALVLRAGALPASIRILEQRTIELP